MAIRVAELQIEIGADTRGAETGMSRVDRGLRDLADVGRTALGVALGGAITRAGQGLVNLGGQALDSYANFERLGASLQQMAARERLATGQAMDMTDALRQTSGMAEELLGWVQQLAIKSPFSQAGVADAYKMAMAYGFNVEEAKRLTQAMIDFAAGSGATEYAMSKIALALGQIRARGKLAGGEVLQLSEAGLNVTEILAKAFNTTTSEVIALREQGLIPADAAIEAIVTSLETNFGGAAERQSGTIAGLINSLEDLADIGQREFFGPLFREFQPDVEAFAETLQDPRTVEQIRLTGQEFARTVREITDGAREVAGFFTNLESGSQAAIIGLGLVALNTGTIIKLTTGLGVVLSGAWQAATVAVRGYNAGLTLTTSLQAALGTMPVTIGAIGAAVASVVGVWVAWNENIEKTNRLGRQNTSDTWGEFFEGLKNKGATEVTNEFVAAYGRVNEVLAQGGIASWFVDREGMARDAMQQFSQALLATTPGYKQYRESMVDAAIAAGLLHSEYRQFVDTASLTAGQIEYLQNRIGLLTQEEYLNAVASSMMADEQQRKFAEMAQYYERMGSSAAATVDLTQKTEELTAAQSKLAEVSDNITAAYGRLREAESQWLGEVGGDLVSQLEQAGLKGERYTEALAAIDDVMGTNYALQNSYKTDLQAIVAEYAKTGDIDGFKTKIGELAEQYKPLSESIREANEEIEKFKRVYDTLRSKVITLNVEVGYNLPPSLWDPTPGYSGLSHGATVEFRAAGGPVLSGQPYWVGERGPEPFIPAVDGRILSVEQAQEALRRAQGGGKGDIYITQNNQINNEMDLYSLAYTLAGIIQRNLR